MFTHDTNVVYTKLPKLRGYVKYSFTDEETHLFNSTLNFYDQRILTSEHSFGRYPPTPIQTLFGFGNPLTKMDAP